MSTVVSSTVTVVHPTTTTTYPLPSATYQPKKTAGTSTTASTSNNQPKTTSTSNLPKTTSTSNTTATGSNTPPRLDYYARYTFKEGAPLKTYLLRKRPGMLFREGKDVVSMSELLFILRDIIIAEKLYDKNNWSMVITDAALEVALNVKMLSFGDIPDFVLKQLKLAPNNNSAKPAPDAAAAAAKNNNDPSLHFLQEGRIVRPRIAPDTKFRVRQAFLAVLYTTPGATIGQQVFTYDELCKLLSRYILNRKGTFFDDRNIKVCICEGDFLGTAFGVRAFHRNQVWCL